MDLGLDGRRALVLASTSGLGYAVAAGLAAEGAAVALNGRDEVRADEAAASLHAAVAVSGDLREQGTAERIVRSAAEALGGLDILVVNTGGGTPGGLLEVPDGSDAAAFAAMLRPALEASRAAAPLLAASGSGRLVFLTARSVVEATPELALSGVFRSGVAAAARSLALELAPSVLVNVMVPGQFDTPALARFEQSVAARDGSDPGTVRRRHLAQIPLGRAGEAEELAAVVVFLCSARASYVTGSVVRVDGGAVRGYH